MVLFTCFNRKEKSVECVNRLINGNPDVSIRFVVVDDSSTDGTATALEQNEHVHVIKGTGDLFYTGGMRKGIDYIKNNTQCKADYILFVNDDVFFHTGCISKMISESITKDNAIIVGATSDKSGNLSYSGIKELKKGPVYKKIYAEGKNLECDTFNANCVLVPWCTFTTLDNMDEKYRHSLGDYDYGLQAKNKGFAIFTSSFYVGTCEDNPQVLTWRDTTLSRVKRIKLKESIKGSPFSEWFYYLNKNYGLGVAIYYSLTPYIRILIGK